MSQRRISIRDRGAKRLSEFGVDEQRFRYANAVGYSDFIYRLLFALHPDARDQVFDFADMTTTLSGFGEQVAAYLGNLRQGSHPDPYGETSRYWLTVIALQDLSNLLSAQEVLKRITAVAEVMLLEASQQIQAQRAGLGILALGKLGGSELNFHSDIDLVFVSNGRDRPATLAARRLIELLSTAWPIDLRLRPFGSAGPLVLNSSAVEMYFQEHGREWERYAWIKARAIAGSFSTNRRLLQSLRPFVYRRYLDFGAIDSLRAMKKRILAEYVTKPLTDNIKMGPGGIREAEFIVQAFQLVRGGRDIRLQTPSFAVAIKTLADRGLLSESESETLLSSYLFLRKIENALQEKNGLATHDIPSAADARRDLAEALGFCDAPEMFDKLKLVQQEIHGLFLLVFGEPKPTVSDKAFDQYQAVWESSFEPEMPPSSMIALRAFDKPAYVYQQLHRFRESRPVRLMGERGRQTLEKLMPVILQRAAQRVHPDKALLRFLDLTKGLLRRSSYLSLFIEQPATIDRCLSLVESSAWLAEQIARTPLILDELIDPEFGHMMPDRVGIKAALDESLASTVRDAEHTRDRLREFHEAQRLRIAAVDVLGHVSVIDVMRTLSHLAEWTIKTGLRQALNIMQERHGPSPALIAILAYGKLGARELGYDSDLDLVFIYEPTRETSSGPQPLPVDLYMYRLSQRVISILTLPGAGPPLYVVDTRLRPEGSAGLIATRYAAWRRYQKKQAWLWEHQALIRARPVAGDPLLKHTVRKLRRHILQKPRSHREVVTAIIAMREKMRSSRPESRLKQALTDLEFLVQARILAYSKVTPQITYYSGLFGQIQAMLSAGVLEEERARAYWLNYQILRTRTQRKALGMALQTGSEDFENILKWLAKEWKSFCNDFAKIRTPS